MCRPLQKYYLVIRTYVGLASRPKDPDRRDLEGPGGDLEVRDVVLNMVLCAGTFPDHPFVVQLYLGLYPGRHLPIGRGCHTVLIFLRHALLSTHGMLRWKVCGQEGRGPVT